MCTLPYPDRFYAAVAFAANPPPTARGVTDETRLFLYALFQQATEGPCQLPKPWSWNVVESAKWTSWKQLTNMPATEAMRLYVRTLEEENANWWQLATSDGDPDKVKAIMEAASAAAAAAVGVEVSMNGASQVIGADEAYGVEAFPLSEKLSAFLDVPATAQWIPKEASGLLRARFDHSAAVLDGCMYVVGGNSRGRYLADIQVLDLATFAWSRVDVDTVPPTPSANPAAPPPSSLPPTAGHQLVPWKGNLLAVGGHTKVSADSLTVYALDPANMSWTRLQPTGAPAARGGHTATILGGNLWVFGGEDPQRHLLNDVHVLNLEEMTWTSPKVKGDIPTARMKHVACAIDERYLLVYGGGSHAHPRADLCMLDTETMHWSVPPSEGVVPSARSGHAGAVVNGCWYISGGGDNTRAMDTTAVLELKAPEDGPLRWRANINSDVPGMVGEGQSVVEVAGALLAFGGYNGEYHKALHVLKPKSSPKPLVAREVQHAANASDPLIENGVEQARQQATADMVATKETLAAEVAAAKDVASQELQLMRRELTAAQEGQAQAEKELNDAKQQLSDEQSKCLRLEVQVAELQQKLEGLAVIEKEMETIRRKEAEAKAEEEKKKSGGLWGYIAGYDAAKAVPGK